MDSFTPKIDFTRTVEHTLVTASGSSILPKHPLKALWNSLSNAVQNTSLEPPIYRLKETLNLLKKGLWLSSVLTEVRHVRTVFCDILSETA
jgi:hypothetical protein